MLSVRIQPPACGITLIPVRGCDRDLVARAEPPHQLMSGWRMSAIRWLAAHWNGRGCTSARRSQASATEALPQRDVRIEILRDQTLLDPLEAVGAQRLGQPHRVRDVEGHPAVEHQLAIVADLFARLATNASFLRRPSNPSAGP